MNVWLAVSVGAIVLGYLLPWLAKRWKKPSGERAMKTFAKRVTSDPAFARSLSAELSERGRAIDEARQAPPPTDAEIPKLVEDLLSNHKLAADVADIRLEKAGLRAESALVKAMQSRKCTWVRSGTHSLDSAPAERVANRLWSMKSRKLGELIGNLWDHKDWRVLTMAIPARAAMGRAELADWMISVLGSDDENASIRHEAIEKGVERAIEMGWAEPELLRRLLEWAKADVFGTGDPEAWAVKFYLDHGGPGAQESLLQPEVLSIDNNRTIWWVLIEFNKRGVRVPSEWLRPLIARSLLPEQPWPWPHVWKDAMIALAVAEPEEARRMAEAILDSDTHARKNDAAEFLRKHHKLPKTWYCNPDPAMRLTLAEQEVLGHVSNITEAVGQIENGGLSQYFFNSSGDNWRRDARSFRVIGDTQTADTLEKAAFMLDPAGASLNSGERRRQYAALSTEREKELESLPCGDHEVLCLRYMIRHADLFQRVEAARVAREAKEEHRDAT